MRRPTSLWATLTKYRVDHWGASSDEMTDGRDREAVADLNEAHVVSSHIAGTEKEDGHSPLDFFSTLDDNGRRHQVVLDVDHQAWLVPSTTPGHFHLYVEIEGGIPETDYFAFIDAAAQIGLIETGYASASKQRGHTDVRLPWIIKGQETTGQPVIDDGQVKTEDLRGL